MFFVGNWRDRPRNFAPSHFTMANYYTDINLKSEMREYSDDLFQNLHLIPDPLKKNLADQFVNPELPTKMPEEKMHMNQEPAHNESTLSGITNFISGVFNVLSSAMFRRAKTEDNQQMASDWRHASKECKNGPSDHILGDDIKNDMSDCRTAATNCEDKLNKVRLLLNSRTTSSPVKFHSRRPKRVFVEPNSIEEHFQDAFSPEEYINLANESYLEYYSPLQYQSPEYIEAQSPNMRTHCKEVNDTIEIGNHLPEITVNKPNVPDNVNNKCVLNRNNTNVEENITKNDLITSCEDKLMKLKAMLQENRKKNTNLQTIQSETETCTESIKKPSKSIPIDKTKDKRFKNPNRLSDKRKKCQIKQSIQDELLFAYEVALDQSSYEESPSFHSLEKIHEDIPFSPSVATPVDCFDEISGKFCNSNSSEDSFQIVFTDVPKLHRLSDCDSEDSFIVFDDSLDSCFTSNDVFGESEGESDSDSDLSDSGFKLSAKLSQTVSDLTEDSLYNEDVVDFGGLVNEEKRSGLLVDERRKDFKKTLPPKKVRFSSDPPKVHVMRVWAFAARQARAGHWERYALDRDRFKRRIADVDMAVSWVLKPQHRSRVMFQRFMPWWNAQKRKEIAEKKQKEEEEKLKKAEAATMNENGKVDVVERSDNKLDPVVDRHNLDIENLDLNTRVDLDRSKEADDVNKVGSKEVNTCDVNVDLAINAKGTEIDYLKSRENNLDKTRLLDDHIKLNCTEYINDHSTLKEVENSKSNLDCLCYINEENKCINNTDEEVTKLKVNVENHDNSLIGLDVEEVDMKYKNEKLSNNTRVDCNEIIYNS
ncbi:hypothetical protein K1T71_000872 [Dendrolimus kikuchii]|uniref:Uncharacterized protein n=1 Tax=Dendrolimus kikuchii TaxID=765133 RepID=A0ACC1DHL9_9NEOP|nr:hypothetical protein K1T71_000872 [Dendrolimus kikuchii]